MEDEADEPIKEQSEDFSSLNSIFTDYKSALQQIMVAPLVPCYNPQNFINFTTVNPSLYLQYYLTSYLPIHNTFGHDHF